MNNPDPALARMRQELADRTTFFTTPPREFNPIGASQEELDRYRLPALPNPQNPALRKKYDFWRRMYSAPLHFEPSDYLLPVASQPLRSDPLRFISAPARFETSRNWSGAYISPRDGRMLVEVYGEWKVPVVKFPAAALAPVTERRSSTWIGLDGQRRYFDSSLPQIGTEQFIESAGGVETRTRRCFFQWWLREEHPPKLPMPLLVNVNDNDSIMASLIVIDETHVFCYLKNQSTGAFSGVWGVEAPEAQLPDGPSPVSVRISGATAEWVMERPTVWNSERLWELPEYTTVNFVNCGAVSALDPMAPGRDESLGGARLINMQRVSANPDRTTSISKAHWQDEQHVMTEYVKEA